MRARLLYAGVGYHSAKFRSEESEQSAFLISGTFAFIFIYDSRTAIYTVYYRYESIHGKAENQRLYRSTFLLSEFSAR